MAIDHQLANANTRSPVLGRYLTLLFSILSLMLIALVALYWIVIFEPSLLAHAESHSHAYSQAQAQSIEKLIDYETDPERLAERLRTTLDAMLLLKEHSTQESFVKRIELIFDYDLVNAPRGSLDLSGGEDACPECFVTEAPIFHPRTHLLVGVATFYSNPTFVYRQLNKLRITLVWVGGIMISLIALAGAGVHHMLQRLSESETNLRSLFEAANIPMVLQRQGESGAHHANQAARHYFALERGEDRLWSSDQWRLLRQTTLRDCSFIDREIQIPSQTSTPRWALASAIPLYFSGAMSRLILLADVTELKAVQEELRSASFTDGLTRIYNRRYLYLRLVKEIDLYQRYHQVFSIILFDLDHFKRINDTYGHRVGDEVLIRVAQVLQDCARSVDVIGRYGGEEFLLILPRSGAEEALQLGERIARSVSTLEWTHSGLHVTLSGGVREYDGVELDAFVEAADARLYQAKHAGRNRILC